jgi:hypothetical protein
MAGEQDFRLQPGALNVIAKELRSHSPCGGPGKLARKINLGRRATKSILNES